MKALAPLCLLLGMGCFAAASRCRPVAPAAALELARGLARPVLMPYLLDGLLAAQRQGNTAEAALRGRSLMRLVPGWTDGHILIAGFMSQSAAEAQLPEAAALERLHAALALLREAQELPGTQRETLQQAMAQELVLRASLSPELASAWQRASGRNPFQQAADWLRELPGYERDPAQAGNLAFCLIDGLPLEIRLGGDRSRLLQMIDSSLRLLQRLADRELASAWADSLKKTRSYLDRSVDISLDELAADPRLAKITAALRAR